jgi:DNA-binding YbaB/EbfC family protein
VFQGLSGLGSLLKQAQEISGRMKGINDELRGRRASGTSGGGMVEVEVNGLLEVLRVRVDPQLFAQADRELLEDLILTAVNQALAKGKELHAEALKTIAGSVDVSGLQETLGKFLGESGPARPPEGET